MTSPSRRSSIWAACFVIISVDTDYKKEVATYTDLICEKVHGAGESDTIELVDAELLVELKGRCSNQLGNGSDRLDDLQDMSQQITQAGSVHHSKQLQQTRTENTYTLPKGVELPRITLRGRAFAAHEVALQQAELEAQVLQDVCQHALLDAETALDAGPQGRGHGDGEGEVVGVAAAGGGVDEVVDDARAVAREAGRGVVEVLCEVVGGGCGLELGVEGVGDLEGHCAGHGDGVGEDVGGCELES